MPDKEQSVNEKMPILQEPQHHPLHPSWHNPWVILASLVIVAFILAGLFSLHARAVVVRSAFGPAGTGMVRRGFSRGGGGTFYNSHSNDTRITGVVTAVNGDTLTVAGDGTTRSVVTSSSTTYSGASSAAVDDTVVAAGSTSGSTFTAQSILVNP